MSMEAQTVLSPCTKKANEYDRWSELLPNSRSLLELGWTNHLPKRTTSRDSKHRSIRLCSALNSSDRHSYDRPFSFSHLPSPPRDFSSSGSTRSVRSGSSPYQKIHSSLAAVSDKGGWMTEPAVLISYTFGSCSAGLGAATRRHTHRMSTSRHFEYERSTGSSSG